MRESVSLLVEEKFLFRNQRVVKVHQEMLNLSDPFRRISKDPVQMMCSRVGYVPSVASSRALSRWYSA
jgi:hypothetical protein